MASPKEARGGILGDFNDLLNVEDKIGRVDHPQWLFDGFRSAVGDCNLVDLHLEGYPFTWWRSRVSIREVRGGMSGSSHG